MGFRLLPGLLLPALAERVDPPVHQVAERDVYEHHERRQGHALPDRAVEDGNHEHAEQRRRDSRPLRRALPARRPVKALLPAPARDLLRLLARPRLPGAGAMLDRPGLRPLVLAPALALGLGHGYEDTPCGRPARTSMPFGAVPAP